MTRSHQFDPPRSFARATRALILVSGSAILAMFVAACGTPLNVTRLSQPGWLPASYLHWSPDGNRLAVTSISGNPPISAIYVADLQLRTMKIALKQGPGQVHVQGWTEDGRQLAFSALSFKDFKDGTWLDDPNTNTPPEFLQSETAMAWSPAGAMAFVREDKATHTLSLALRDPETGKETVIFSSAGAAINSVFWSSDGSRLVFAFQKESEKSSIYIFDPGTGQVTQVSSAEDQWNPSLSPDGKLIAYSKWDPNQSSTPAALHILKSDGSCDVEVPGRLDVYSPTWSPHGKYIAYVGISDSNVYLLDLVGSFGRDIVRWGLPCP